MMNSGETLFAKRVSPHPFPKTFNLNNKNRPCAKLVYGRFFENGFTTDGISCIMNV